VKSCIYSYCNAAHASRAGQGTVFPLKDAD
jgi:hypothetical protein